MQNFGNYNSFEVNNGMQQKAHISAISSIFSVNLVSRTFQDGSFQKVQYHMSYKL